MMSENINKKLYGQGGDSQGDECGPRERMPDYEEMIRAAEEGQKRLAEIEKNQRIQGLDK